MKNFWLRLAIAAVVVFLGAIPLAQASGFYRIDGYIDTRGTTNFAAGVILFLFSMALFGPVARLGSHVIATLSQAETRPAPVVALGLIICGTLCVITSLGLAWSGRPQSQSADMGQFLHAMGGNNGAQMSLNVGTQSASAGPMILTIAVFLVGSALIALGVWASIPHTPAAASHAMVKPEVPELAEVPA